MPPPEIWGPAVWTLFHTLIEKINDQAYPMLFQQLFLHFQKICKFLPCPECSRDATNFLAKTKLNNLKNKNDFKNLFYIFHNYVNSKKKKQLFNFININIYKNFNIINVINKFIINYNTKGNMNLISDSFQRQFVIKDFKKWISYNMKAFYPIRIHVSVNEITKVKHNNSKEDNTKEEVINNSDQNISIQYQELAKDETLDEIVEEMLIRSEVVEDNEVINESENVEESESFDESEVVEDNEVINESEVVEDNESFDESENVEESEVINESENVEESEVINESEVVEESEVINESEIVEDNEVINESENVEDNESFDESENVEDNEVINESEVVEDNEKA